MTRVDFLYSVLVSVIFLKIFMLGYDFIVYVALFFIPLYAFMAWMKQIQINILLKSGNFASDEFNEKYKDLPE